MRADDRWQMIRKMLLLEFTHGMAWHGMVWHDRNLLYCT
jgi:hypothetical protein